MPTNQKRHVCVTCGGKSIAPIMRLIGRGRNGKDQFQHLTCGVQSKNINVNPNDTSGSIVILPLSRCRIRSVQSQLAHYQNYLQEEAKRFTQLYGSDWQQKSDDAIHLERVRRGYASG